MKSFVQAQLGCSLGEGATEVPSAGELIRNEPHTRPAESGSAREQAPWVIPMHIAVGNWLL